MKTLLEKQPFEKKYILNYILLYGAVVVIILLFYILNTNLNTIQQHEKKEFNKEATSLHKVQSDNRLNIKDEKPKSNYLLLAPVHQ